MKDEYEGIKKATEIIHKETGAAAVVVFVIDDVGGTAITKACVSAKKEYYKNVPKILKTCVTNLEEEI